MTYQEKEKIYNLLKTASDNYYGYKSPEFSENIVFEDDVEVVLEAESTNPIGVATSVVSNTGGTTATTESDLSAKSPTPVVLDTDELLSFEKIATKVASCTRCALCQNRNRTVPGMGVKNPIVLVIGEGPGEEEDSQGLPFVGPAGQLLDKMLASISLDRKVNCYIANIVKCRPPKNRTPYPDEANACRPFLDAQIHLLKPKMILCAGRCAIQNLLHTESSLSQLRGKFLEYQNIPVLATYHPSALLRDASNKRPAWEDLKLFRSKLLEIDPDYAKDFRGVS